VPLPLPLLLLLLLAPPEEELGEWLGLELCGVLLPLVLVAEFTQVKVFSKNAGRLLLSRCAALFKVAHSRAGEKGEEGLCWREKWRGEAALPVSNVSFRGRKRVALASLRTSSLRPARIASLKTSRR
jgi:hypothetical protein